jgi:Tol biopolymer transport system component
VTTVPSQLGPYTITREIGRGGMGVVYLARDTKLDRDVAIKALPEDLADDVDRLARFEREAKTLAQLNHANVAGIHGVEEQDGQRYLILEYVEGETLAERLDRGAMPVDEALEVAIAIASGVEAAHEAGIIHRDLKPDNIKITSDGAVKVLDFGLARTAEGQSGSSVSDAATVASPTPRTPHSPTTPGAILGTAPYMSPEQARGRRLDKRSDIWSFGVILYEMLTGASPFVGETVSDSIGAILHKDIELERLPERTPGRARHVLDRCLQRDRNLRMRDIGDARLELSEALTGREWTAARLDAASSASSMRRLRAGALLVFGAVIGVVIGVAAAVIWLSLGGKDSPVVPMRFELPLVFEGETVAIDDLAISPDGTVVVIAPVGDGPLLLRDLDSLEVRALPGTDSAEAPFFSPDGHWIAFFQGDQLLRVPRDGGPALAITNSREFDPKGLWIDERTILVTGNQAFKIWRVDLETGRHDMLVDVPAELGILGFEESLCAMPGRDYVLAAGYTGNAVDTYCVLSISLDDGAVEVVLRSGTYPMVASGNEIVFLRDSSLYMVPFDPVTRSVTGRERLVLEGVSADEWGGNAVAALSHSGTLIYVPGDRLSKGRRIVRVSQDGVTEPITEPDAVMRHSLDISPAGDHIVFSTVRRSHESWLYDVDRGNMQLISNAGESYDFCWSPDGERLTYRTQLPERGYEMSDVIIRDVASGVAPRTIATLPEIELRDWFPDRSALLLSQLKQFETSSSFETRLFELSLDEPDELKPIFDQAGASINDARFSPDGRWLAYISDESGQDQLYVHQYPELNRAWQVSFALSAGIIWSPDSKALYWQQDDRMMKASVGQDEHAVSIGAPAVALASPWPRAASRWLAWEMGPDGNFYAVAPAEWEQSPEPLRVIVNWVTETSRQSNAR